MISSSTSGRDRSSRSRAGKRLARRSLGLAVLLALGAGGYFCPARRPPRRRPTSGPRPSRRSLRLPPPGPSPRPAKRSIFRRSTRPTRIVRELVAKLSSHPTVAAWLTTDQLIRNFTAGRRQHLERPDAVRDTSEKFGRRRFPGSGGSRRPVDRPSQLPAVRQVCGRGVGLDARGAARLYATLKPRIQDGYRELGHPDGNVDPGARAGASSNC